MDEAKSLTMKKCILGLCLIGSFLCSDAVAQVKAGRKKYTNMEIAFIIEEALVRLHNVAIDGTDVGLGGAFHYNVRQWTQADIDALAKSPQSYIFFELLLDIAYTSVVQDKNGQYTVNATEAQKALTYLKPDCCKTWKGFCGMIANASDATEVLRAQYHARKKKH